MAIDRSVAYVTSYYWIILTYILTVPCGTISKLCILVKFLLSS